MRFKTLDQFKKGEVNVMVATDVAARGLDIPDVGLVINVTFPLTTGASVFVFWVGPRVDVLCLGGGEWGGRG